MTTTGPVLDETQYRWVEVSGEPALSCRVHHHLSILGYDREAGTIDMLIRFDAEGGHCQPHRHLSNTSVLVLRGEQHLQDLLPDGTRVAKVRRAGEHHLTAGDAHPHLERGGPDGALVFYSHHSPDGRLYEIIDDECRPVSTVTVDSLADMWEAQQQ